MFYNRQVRTLLCPQGLARVQKFPCPIQTIVSNVCSKVFQMNETQIKIIEAAEIEFAERGYGGASIREITKRAGVNIAAINYHFGTKEVLFKEMVRHRIEPINHLRIDMLEKATIENDSKPLPIQKVVDFMVRPLLSQLIGEPGTDFRLMRAMGKAMSEERAFMKELHQDSVCNLPPTAAKGF